MATVISHIGPTVRAYYKVSMSALNRSTRLSEARSQGITGSKFAHENPVVRLSPDQKTALVRAHYAIPSVGPKGSKKAARFRDSEGVADTDDGAITELEKKVGKSAGKRKHDAQGRVEPPSAYEGKAHVTRLSEAEARALVDSWQPADVA